MSIIRRFEKEADYFYPLPNNNVLRNRGNHFSITALRSFLDKEVDESKRQLLANPDLIVKTYDAEHLRAIHRHLFKNVYQWAGEFRTVNLTKEYKQGPRVFARISMGEVDREMDDIHDCIRETDWVGLDREGFATAAAEVYAHLNYARPFRDGSARAAKIFMDHVAEQSQFALKFDRVQYTEWRLALEASLPKEAWDPVQPEELVEVFRQMTLPRLEAAESSVVGTQVRLNASYPSVPRTSASTSQEQPRPSSSQPARVQHALRSGTSPSTESEV